MPRLLVVLAGLLIITGCAFTKIAQRDLLAVFKPYAISDATSTVETIGGRGNEKQHSNAIVRTLRLKGLSPESANQLLKKALARTKGWSITSEFAEKGALATNAIHRSSDGIVDQSISIEPATAGAPGMSKSSVIAMRLRMTTAAASQ